MTTNLKIKLKNVTNGKKYVTDIIEKYKKNEIVNNIVILELLQYHPTKRIHIENIEYLIVRLRKPFNNLALYYKYKDHDIEDDISYILCIKNLFGKYNENTQYEKDVLAAFRNESHVGSKKQYFINNTKIKDNSFYGICKHCQIETKNITTDHFPTSYKNIFSNFLLLENIILSNVEIDESDTNEIKIKNQEFAIKFRIFHDEHASYRLLCKSCNSHFGSYENYLQPTS